MKKRVSLLLAVIMLVTAMAAIPAPAAPDLSQKEAPNLVEQVAAGTQPALADRLPGASDVMVEQDVLSLGE